MEVKFHAFLTPALDVGEFSASQLCPLIPGKEALMRIACVAACPREFLSKLKYSKMSADVGN
jgi:hypothetical protein